MTFWAAKNWDERGKDFWEKGRAGVIEASRREGGGDEAERGVTASKEGEHGKGESRRRKGKIGVYPKLKRNLVLVGGSYLSFPCQPI